MRRSIGLATRLKATDEQSFCVLDGEAAILHLTAGQYYGLDGAGVRVWELIQEPRAVSDLLQALLAEYEVSPEILRKDVIDLLEKLEKERLVEVLS